ncbi:hypothetical protein [Myxococcus sp. AM010]|uniref:hypothetical protein n=1 Tax=Myxococcus sp. AM010 TaxID=2745138 RepID=UPI0020D0981E|nr:hypothetical protein [Myxococcus sp. AM010]
MTPRHEVPARPAGLRPTVHPFVPRSKRWVCFTRTSPEGVTSSRYCVRLEPSPHANPCVATMMKAPSALAFTAPFSNWVQLTS